MDWPLLVVQPIWSKDPFWVTPTTVVVTALHDVVVSARIPSWAESCLASARTVWKLTGSEYDKPYNRKLGRNTRNLLALIDDLEHRGVHFRSVTEGISTTGPMGRAMLTVMSAFAQLERDQLAERTRAGMAAAAERGRKAGRRELTAEHFKVRRAKDLRAQGLAPGDIGKIIGASRATVYRYLSMGLEELT